MVDHEKTANIEDRGGDLQPVQGTACLGGVRDHRGDPHLAGASADCGTGASDSTDDSGSFGTGTSDSEFGTGASDY